MQAHPQQAIITPFSSRAARAASARRQWPTCVPAMRLLIRTLTAYDATHDELTRALATDFPGLSANHYGNVIAGEQGYLWHHPHLIPDVDPAHQASAPEMLHEAF